MVRLRVAELLRERGLKPYNLFNDAGFSTVTSYKLAGETGHFTQITAETIDRLCAYFGVTPCELFAYTPANAPKGRGRRARG